jgi:hypothetical protein
MKALQDSGENFHFFWAIDDFFMNLNFLGIFQKFWPNLRLSAIWIILSFDQSARFFSATFSSAICTSAFNIFTIEPLPYIFANLNLQIAQNRNGL